MTCTPHPRHTILRSTLHTATHRLGVALSVLALAACGGGGGGGSGSPPAAAPADADPVGDYAGTPFSVLSRVSTGPASQYQPETRLTDLVQRNGVWYGVTRFKAANITQGNRCFQALDRTRISTCAGYEIGDSPTPGADNRFLLDPQTNGAVFHTVVTPPMLGGADTQYRLTLTPMVAGWSSATYAGLQKPRLALVASRYFVVMDLMAGGLGSTPYLSVLDYAARFQSPGLSFPTPQPIYSQLFGLANLNTPNYPTVMDFDFAVHDGRLGLYAFLSRPDSKSPAAGGSQAGTLQLWQHDGTTLAPLATRGLPAVARPFTDATSSYWQAHGVRLVRNAAQPARPFIVVLNETTGGLDIYRHDGSTTLQPVALGVARPTGFVFASAPMVAVGDTLYLAARRSVYRLGAGTLAVVAGDAFNQGGSLSPFTDVDVLASDGTALVIGVGREFTDVRQTVADVLRLPLP